MPCIPSATASRFSSMTLSSVKPGSVLPLYNFSFWSRVRLACLGGTRRVSVATMAAIPMEWSDALAFNRLGVEVLLVDLDLVLHPDEVGHVIFHPAIAR